MAERTHLTPRQKYGEELRRRRLAAGLTQQELAEMVVCSHTLISHIEAGRRLPQPDDARRLDQALGTDGWFERWLLDLERRYISYFAEVAELEKSAAEIRLFASMLVPGLLQTEDYARAVYRAYKTNFTLEEVDQLVVNRLDRARILSNPTSPVVWALLDEAVIRRPVGGGPAMAKQLLHVADTAESGRIRLHVLPFCSGAHALMEGVLTLMKFEDSTPVAYTESIVTGNLMDDPALVAEARAAYDLALSDALSHHESLALIREFAEGHAHER
ncbi:helix-turn-helix transcriptional regulator [Streptomyces axinellae]|uniref:Helix-turn-helix transcriptional regulator n=1 Tax=Streptomyces axinellae TaxID=552788 RepID=A0ABN3QCW6_9ACTN